MGKKKLADRHGHPWYPPEINLLRGWVKAGVGIAEVARRLLRSEFAIKCAIEKYCLKMPSKRLVINGRDYDRILNVAMDNLSSRIFLNAEISAACQGIPGSIKSYYGSQSTRIRGF